LEKLKQEPNFINYINSLKKKKKKMNNGRRRYTSINQIDISPTITEAIWNSNYDVIIDVAKRSRD